MLTGFIPLHIYIVLSVNQVTTDRHTMADLLKCMTVKEISTTISSPGINCEGSNNWSLSKVQL